LVKRREREEEDKPFCRVVLVPDDGVAVVAGEFVVEVVIADSYRSALRALGWKISGLTLRPESRKQSGRDRAANACRRTVARRSSAPDYSRRTWLVGRSKRV
jgi:hypothetical protein